MVLSLSPAAFPAMYVRRGMDVVFCLGLLFFLSLFSLLVVLMKASRRSMRFELSNFMIPRRRGLAETSTGSNYERSIMPPNQKVRKTSVDKGVSNRVRKTHAVKKCREKCTSVEPVFMQSLGKIWA